jgi:hypothetical protein
LIISLLLVAAVVHSTVVAVVRAAIAQVQNLL